MADDDPAETDSVPEIACTLDEGEARRRRAAFEADLRPDLAAVGAREGGVALTFERSDGTLPAVARFVAAESRCCPFASFEVAVEPPHERVELTVTDPEGAGEFLRKGVAEALDADPTP